MTACNCGGGGCVSLCKTAPTAGVYTMPEAEYFANPALSCSGAKLLLPPSCPAKYKFALTHPQPPRDVFDFGHAAHKLVLGEGAEIGIVIADDWRSKAARDQRDEYRAKGVTPMLHGDYQRAQAMADAVLTDPIAGPLFTNGKPEQSIKWTDERTGTPLRARVDWLPDAGGEMTIVDLKTCRSADPNSISRAMVTYGYALQAAWYTTAIEAIHPLARVRFAFVFVEKQEPHLITVAMPDALALQLGREQMREAIDIYRKCQANDRWPSYADEAVVVSLPAWAEPEMSLDL